MSVDTFAAIQVYWSGISFAATFPNTSDMQRSKIYSLSSLTAIHQTYAADSLGLVRFPSIELHPHLLSSDTVVSSHPHHLRSDALAKTRTTCID